LILLAPSAHAAFPGANGKIMFFHGNWPYTMNPDGTDLHMFPIAVGGAYSPDGRRISYTWGDVVYIANSDGTDSHKAFSGAYGAAWSPDQTQFAYNTYTDGLRVANIDGSGRHVLTSNRFDRDPSWSPDGSLIAFDQPRVVRDGQTARDIFVVNPDGTNQRNLTGHSYAAGPNWSPDSTHIAYTVNDSEIDVVDLAGHVTRLLERFAAGPVWSPDGTKILYSGAGGPGSYLSDLWMMNPDGTGQTRLTDTPDLSEFPLDWQPINRPPECSNVTAAPDMLWPPNHRRVPVSLSGATDPDGNQVILTVTGVTQDEPTRRSPDATLGPASDQLTLRATRSGRGDGRVYRIAFNATDGRGGECSGTTTVGVPRRKNRAAVDSAPPSYDSLAGAPGS
jgi:hypothetical protein